jgi:hypothetical protein
MARGPVTGSKTKYFVAFDERGSVPDGYGNLQSDWVEQFRDNAEFTFMRSSETVMAGRLEGRNTVLARVRASNNTRRVTSDWRMRDVRNGIAYAVRSVAASPDRASIEILTESGVAVT